MIRVYLVRHGIAADGSPDELRPLTAGGRRRFRRAARAFAGLDEPLDHLFTSPLVRAIQTAEILASALRRDEVELLDELRSDVLPAKLLAEVARRVKVGESVGLVGHDPQITAVVRTLAKAGRDQPLDVRKGSIVRIDVNSLPEPEEANPRWWLKPKSRQLAEGLPGPKKKPSGK
jgi:phosphohistidine phosphatase